MKISSVLFAAGRGQRLLPLTDWNPKPALPLLDVPLAAWGLAALARHAAPVVVNVSHRADQVLAALGRTGIHGWKPFVEAPEAYGTAGTLRALRDRSGSRVVTWNGDVLADLELPDLLSSHQDSRASATLVVRKVSTAADLSLDGDAVAGFIDRRVDPDASGARFLGIAVFERNALKRLPDERPAGLGETLLRDLAESGDLNVHVAEGYARDVGTPSQYLEASLDVLSGAAPRPPVVLPGRVVESRGGTAYLGPETRAPLESLGPGAILLRGSGVQAGARVTNTVVMPDCVVPAGRDLSNTIWPALRPYPTSGGAR